MFTGSLKSDHGKYLTAEHGGGNEGDIQNFKLKGVAVADRDNPGGPGDWQTLSIVSSDEAEYVGLRVETDQTDGPRYACAENAGVSGSVVFNRPSLGEWEKWKLWRLDDGKVAFESKVRPGYFIKAWPWGAVTLSPSVSEGVPVERPGGYESWTPTAAIGGGVVAPVGGHRFVGQVHMRGDGFYDANGPIRFVGIHVGNLFGLFCRDETAASDAVKTISLYPVVQFWMQLGSIPGSSYWNGEELGPRYTPDYWGKFDRFLSLLSSHGMKAVVCGGDFHGWRVEDTRELAKHCNDTVALYIVGNEAWQTGADSKEQLQKHIGAFKQINTVVPCTTTAAPTEEAGDIREWCAGDFYAMHGYRNGEDHDRIRHIFSVPWEGQPPTRHGYQDEPTGPGSEVSVKASHCYHGRDVDAHHMCALAVMSLLTNQGFNYFCSEGVRYSPNIVNRAGFREVANVHALVPQDIMTWPGPMHSGTSQPNRAFDIVSGNHLRVDHRFGSGGRIFGLAYGDQGPVTFRMRRAMHVVIKNMDGTVLHERDFNAGDQYSLTFERSRDGQPGFTAVILDGHLL